ncbi:hypothetical protein PAXRUDRAFT_495694 [Paxillus rubicundulus Ve08.2h10]|uniref:Uncharacterized protein n=1 Tax=Paxillus rubicundulus Ve08.2h10 TaxID=930991 RepID=A0A0D0D5F3_9AGAM|nr:hypothetical protein PAXRUDRAFT_495694 [Paxillus rubicundulus Ve08.2h10]
MSKPITYFLSSSNCYSTLLANLSPSRLFISRPLSAFHFTSEGFFSSRVSLYSSVVWVSVSVSSGIPSGFPDTSNHLPPASFFVFALALRGAGRYMYTTAIYSVLG